MSSRLFISYSGTFAYMMSLLRTGEVGLISKYNYWPNIGVMLVHCLWRRPNIKTILHPRFLLILAPTLTQRRANVSSLRIDKPCFLLQQPRWPAVTWTDPDYSLEFQQCRGASCTERAEIVCERPRRTLPLRVRVTCTRTDTLQLYVSV